MTLPKTLAVDFEQYKEFTLRPFKANYDAALEKMHACEERLDSLYEQFQLNPTDENDKLWRKAFKELGAAIVKKNRAKHELRAQERKATVDYYFKHLKQEKRNK